MILDVRLLHYRYAKLIVVVGVIGGLGYMDFAAFYSLGYQEIYKHHSKGVAIALWTLLAYCEVSVFIYWALIFAVGPGKSPIFAPFNLYNIEDPDEPLVRPPDYFLCDEWGYPYYCSSSSSLSANRSFFSRDLQYRVLRFDHYCVWVGNVIGESNYVFFLKYMIWFLAFFIVMLVHLIRYTPSNVNRGEINHNFIVLYILCGFWIIMLSALLGVHLRYVCINMTTLDEITVNQRKQYLRWKEHNKEDSKKKGPRKEEGIRYVNVRRDGDRLVVSYDISQSPFNMGYRKNWINLVFNGNRNHGKPESFYTTKKFVHALSVIILPFVEIPVVLRHLKRPDTETSEEKTLVGEEQRLAHFESYNSEFNQDFIKFLNDKIDRKECHLASYLQPPQSQADGSAPVSSNSNSEGSKNSQSGAIENSILV